MRRLLACALLLAVSAPAAAQKEYAHPKTDLNGRLFRSVFQTAPPYLSSGDIAGLPDPLRARLSTYLTRRAAFTSSYEGTASGFEGAASDAKKRALERAIVSIVDDPKAGALAIAFLKEAPIAAEWKLGLEGPTAEAAFAEDYLERQAAPPLAPFLYIFIAHRQRAAFEVAERARAAAAQAAAARKYRTFLQRARAAQDPIYGLIADDLDRQAYVYTPAVTHPRDFNPGG